MQSRAHAKIQTERRERALAALLDFAQDAADNGDDRDALQLDNVRRLLEAAWAPVEWQSLCAAPLEGAADERPVATSDAPQRRGGRPDVMFGKAH
ncbi:hypothetical protein G3576_11860 [Roseomonas stagni]|uniref:Uncharacterized protein n=1 Tax=Falsiroseomonas algicola TaxID=2716930 RepID=A0A6M1LK66_9PROT|nr:hypothetical protein [Falsiroseomonas algicola]NGM20710.1 hypothetical protein [Falsiroseomonas algicola]